MFELPWGRETVPHCVIELTQRCNLACRNCYREKRDVTKTVAAVLDEVALLERHQRVHTVSLAGGEPTLHPQLVEIVRRVKARGHRVSLVTNAVALTDDLLRQLKPAGLDVVMIHVDEGQQRPELPAGAGLAEVNALRRAIAARVAAHGLDAGLCVTIYPETLRHLPALLRCFLECRELNYLFATHAIGIRELVSHLGEAGYQGAPTRNSDVAALLRREFGLEPFAGLAPSVPNGGEWPCLTYYLPVLHDGAHSRYLALHSGGLDRALIRLSRLLAGRYLYYTPHRFATIACQVLVNGLGSGRPLRALGFVGRALRHPARLRGKRLVFENAPVITAEGRINCCDACPNATVRDGRVVPVCLADHAAALTGNRHA